MYWRKRKQIKDIIIIITIIIILSLLLPFLLSLLIIITNIIIISIIRLYLQVVIVFVGLVKPYLGVAKRNEAKKRFKFFFFSAKVMKGDGPERKTISMWSNKFYFCKMTWQKKKILRI